MLRDRTAEVNRVALDRLLQHTRRGSLQVLWDTALAEVEARLANCEDTPKGTQSSEANLRQRNSDVKETHAAHLRARGRVCMSPFLPEGLSKELMNIAKLNSAANLMCAPWQQAQSWQLRSAVWRAHRTQWRKWWSTSGAAGWTTTRLSLT